MVARAVAQVLVAQHLFLALVLAVKVSLVALHQLVAVLVALAVAVGQQQSALTVYLVTLVMVAQVTQHQSQVVQSYTQLVAVAHRMAVSLAHQTAARLQLHQRPAQLIEVMAVAVHRIHQTALQVLAVAEL